MNLWKRVGIAVAGLVIVLSLSMSSLSLLQLGAQARRNCGFAKANRAALISVVEHLTALIPDPQSPDPRVRKFVGFVQDEGRLANVSIHC